FSGRFSRWIPGAGPPGRFGGLSMAALGGPNNRRIAKKARLVCRRGSVVTGRKQVGLRCREESLFGKCRREASPQIGCPALRWTKRNAVVSRREASQTHPSGGPGHGAARPPLGSEPEQGNRD